MKSKITVRFRVPDNAAAACREKRYVKTMTNEDLHNVDLNPTQVLAYNRVNLFSERRDLLSLPPETCDGVEDHRVYKVNGGLY